MKRMIVAGALLTLTAALLAVIATYVAADFYRARGPAPAVVRAA